MKQRRVGRPAAQLLAQAGPTMTLGEAARVLGCSRGTAYALAASGDLASMGIRVLRLGRCLRVATADLRRAVGVIETPRGGTR